MAEFGDRIPGNIFDKDFEKFNQWSKQRFNEVKRTYPNLVWNQPQISQKKIIWENLQGSMKVICRKVSNCSKIREVYIDDIRQTIWDREE